MSAMSPMGPGLPAGPAPGMPAPQQMGSEEAIIQMISALLEKWGGQQATVAGEQGSLAQVLMQLLQGGGAVPPAEVVDGGGSMGNMGYEPAGPEAYPLG